MAFSVATIPSLDGGSRPGLGLPGLAIMITETWCALRGELWQYGRDPDHNIPS